MRGIGLGVVIAIVAASGAQAAELSVTDRLEDRRVVAAGTRAQVLGFADGRFYANGWHITGEMGGIVTPPLKLLDSLSFAVNNQWVGPATRFTSGWGYTGYELPAVHRIGLTRTDFVPDGRRGALIGLTLENPHPSRRAVRVAVEVRSELLAQYPWGFDGVDPHASENALDSASFDGSALMFRDTGSYGDVPHDYTALVGSDREPKRARLDVGGYGPFGDGRRCEPMDNDTRPPSACDDGPFGNGTGGRLIYKVKLTPRGETTVWIAVAGSDNSVAEARAELAALTDAPGAQLAAKRAKREQLGARTQVELPGDPRLAAALDWGKQNLADLTQLAEDLEIRWADEGREWTFEGDVDRIKWVGAGFPDYPWMFATDAEYTAFANVALGQFGPMKANLRSLQEVSDVLNDSSGVVVHEVVADGSVWHGKDTGATDPYDFNTDELVKFPSAVALLWRWTGDDAFRDELLDFSQRTLAYVAANLDDDGDGWPEGLGNVERSGMGEEKLDNAVYYIRGLYDFADMARDAGRFVDEANAAEALADSLVAKFETDWWIETEQQYADSLRDPGNVKVNQKHWIGSTPMDAELVIDGEYVPGIASFAHGSAGLAGRENNCYSGERPGNRGLFHTGCGGGPTGEGEFSIFSLTTSVQSIGEGNYGRLAETQQQRYTDANAETMFAEPATGGTPDEMPGAMPEIFPSWRPDGGWGFDPNIDRCWTCRSMFMQAWGHYGTAWAVVHHYLGVQPQLGVGLLDVVPHVPEGSPSVHGSAIRLGAAGELAVSASRAGSQFTTITSATGLPAVQRFRIGHVLPRGSSVASVTLDGAPATWTPRETNRGLEVLVETTATERHTLVVTAG